MAHTSKKVVNVAIDLGTSIVVAVEIDKDTAKVVARFPALYDLNSGQQVDFLDAQYHDTTISQAKRYLGLSDLEAIMVKRESKHPFSMKGNKFAAPDGRLVSAEEISATYLRKIMDLYPQGTTVKAVITVPAHFGDNQRQATTDAAQIAGLEVLQLINEPTAATLPYVAELPLNSKIVTIDLGGGTLDVSVLELTEDGLVVKATAGDPHLGGYDIDGVVVKWALSKYKRESGSFIAPNGPTAIRLRQAAKQCKEALSTQMSAEVTVEYNGSRTVTTSVTRDDFEKIARPTLTRLTTHLFEALDDAKLAASDVEIVIMVGGSSRIPLVAKIIREELPTATILDNVKADEAVALGAAEHLKNLVAVTSNELVPIPITEICNATLGIEIKDDGFDGILEKGQPLPASEERHYQTVTDFQQEVTISVYRGENVQASKNTLLGVFRLDVLPMPKGELKLAVEFSMTVNGTLDVTAKELNGRKKARTVAIKSNNCNLTEDEMKLAIANLV